MQGRSCLQSSALICTCALLQADEELLLLEALDMYGPGNWKDVWRHVGTKSEACSLALCAAPHSSMLMKRLYLRFGCLSGHPVASLQRLNVHGVQAHEQ